MINDQLSSSECLKLSHRLRMTQAQQAWQSPDREFAVNFGKTQAAPSQRRSRKSARCKPSLNHAPSGFIGEAWGAGLTKTKAAADLVLRYLTARSLFRQTPWEMPSNLEYLIGRGVRLLPGGVVINEVPLKPAPAIIFDREDPKFWSAIIGGEDNAIDLDPVEQQQVRQFVIYDDWTWPVPSVETRATGS
jgi:hypothetical protein